jgi:hypothetical protein
MTPATADAIRVLHDASYAVFPYPQVIARWTPAMYAARVPYQFALDTLTRAKLHLMDSDRKAGL